ncbi:ORF147 [Ranid herpesvirus 2]|uniref:ORF147 n=1 Tax=Ranid herpesvirus 2 TaxID=389214 RepID=Q14VV9_9VIRU|nr:ORF147 [Ranid herpesvirus 2]ABG25580.1 ORF147 [Ranid herpesvirus 2]
MPPKKSGKAVCKRNHLDVEADPPQRKSTRIQKRPFRYEEESYPIRAKKPKIQVSNEAVTSTTVAQVHAPPPTTPLNSPVNSRCPSPSYCPITDNEEEEVVLKAPRGRMSPTYSPTSPLPSSDAEEEEPTYYSDTNPSDTEEEEFPPKRHPKFLRSTSPSYTPTSDTEEEDEDTLEVTCDADIEETPTPSGERRVTFKTGKNKVSLLLSEKLLQDMADGHVITCVNPTNNKTMHLQLTEELLSEIKGSPPAPTTQEVLEEGECESSVEGGEEEEEEMEEEEGSVVQEEEEGEETQEPTLRYTLVETDTGFEVEEIKITPKNVKPPPKSLEQLDFVRKLNKELSNVFNSSGKDAQPKGKKLDFASPPAPPKAPFAFGNEAPPRAPFVFGGDVGPQKAPFAFGGDHTPKRPQEDRAPFAFGSEAPRKPQAKIIVPQPTFNIVVPSNPPARPVPPPGPHQEYTSVAMARPTSPPGYTYSEVPPADQIEKLLLNAAIDHQRQTPQHRCNLDVIIPTPQHKPTLPLPPLETLQKSEDQSETPAPIKDRVFDVVYHPFRSSFYYYPLSDSFYPPNRKPLIMGVRDWDWVRGMTAGLVVNNNITQHQTLRNVLEKVSMPHLQYYSDGNAYMELLMQMNCSPAGLNGDYRHTSSPFKNYVNDMMDMAAIFFLMEMTLSVTYFQQKDLTSSAKGQNPPFHIHTFAQLRKMVEESLKGKRAPFDYSVMNIFELDFKQSEVYYWGLKVLQMAKICLLIQLTTEYRRHFPDDERLRLMQVLITGLAASFFNITSCLDDVTNYRQLWAVLFEGSREETMLLRGKVIDMTIFPWGCLETPEYRFILQKFLSVGSYCVVPVDVILPLHHHKPLPVTTHFCLEHLVERYALREGAPVRGVRVSPDLPMHRAPIVSLTEPSNEAPLYTFTCLLEKLSTEQQVCNDTVEFTHHYLMEHNGVSASMAAQAQCSPNIIHLELQNALVAHPETPKPTVHTPSVGMAKVFVENKLKIPTWVPPTTLPGIHSQIDAKEFADVCSQAAPYLSNAPRSRYYFKLACKELYKHRRPLSFMEVVYVLQHTMSRIEREMLKVPYTKEEFCKEHSAELIDMWTTTLNAIGLSMESFHFFEFVQHVYNHKYVAVRRELQAWIVTKASQHGTPMKADLPFGGPPTAMRVVSRRREVETPPASTSESPVQGLRNVETPSGCDPSYFTSPLHALRQQLIDLNEACQEVPSCSHTCPPPCDDNVRLTPSRDL